MKITSAAQAEAGTKEEAAGLAPRFRTVLPRRAGAGGWSGLERVKRVPGRWPDLVES
jgi:hypothetical protein